MILSKNLTLAEVTKSDTAIKNGIDNTPHGKHLDNLIAIAQDVYQPVRDHFGKPLGVSNGYRAPALNKIIGGASNSQHCTGQALDLDGDMYGGIKNCDIFHFIKDNLVFDQLIWEFGNDANPDWVHVSYRMNGPNRMEALRASRVDKKTVYTKC